LVAPFVILSLAPIDAPLGFACFPTALVEQELSTVRPFAQIFSSINSSHPSSPSQAQIEVSRPEKNMPQTTIPARHGVATPLLAGQTIKIINTAGTQVVDTWAFTLSSFPPSPSSLITSQMSMQHTRASLNRIIPKVGDGLYNNERVKMLTVTEDTTSGIHDTMIAACDKQRYEELGGGSEHRNCADNLVEGLGALGKY
jgi:uncharacterized protein YcgI (DUF1989 family)